MTAQCQLCFLFILSLSLSLSPRFCRFFLTLFVCPFHPAPFRQHSNSSCSFRGTSCSLRHSLYDTQENSVVQRNSFSFILSILIFTKFSCSFFSASFVGHLRSHDRQAEVTHWQFYPWHQQQWFILILFILLHLQEMKQPVSQ